MRMKYLFILLCLCSLPLYGQDARYADSLRSALQQGGRDTNRVNALYRYGELFEDEQPDTALSYYLQAHELAREIKYLKGEAAFASYCLPVLNNRGEYRRALDIAREALEIYKRVGTRRDLAVAYLNVGSEWQYLSDFQAAADNYLEALKYAEQVNDTRLLRMTNNNLASVFLSLSQFEKGRDYARTGLQYAYQLNKDGAVASSLYNLATAAVYLERYDTALVLFHEIEQIAQKLNDDFFYLDAWIGKAGAYDGLGVRQKALYYFDKVIVFAKQKEVPEYEMYAYMGKAEHYLKYNDHAGAADAIRNGLVLAEQLETRFERKDLLLKASKLNEKTGNYREALRYFKEAQVLNDSITGENHRIAIANNEARYEFNKKELAISSLLAENALHQSRIEQQRTLNIALVAGSILLLLVFFLVYRNVKHKQKLQKQRISELETEKKLTATEAIIKGEEQERSRLAKDLHDGLGGMLSGVKYTLHNMKENLVLTEDNARAFEHSLQMLDSSISEMRRVAHNMMPESLLKFGLDTALRDFCSQVTVSGILRVSYQSFGLSGKEPEQSLAITIYRVVQELLNNTIKHASAHNVIVQLAAEEGQITLTVEDDGKGFDTATLRSARGIGWKNILSRLDYHNGKLDVRSSPEKGTSVYIEFKTA